MNYEIEFRIPRTEQSGLQASIAAALKDSAKVSEARLAAPPGTLPSLDPDLVRFVIEILNTGAAVAAVKSSITAIVALLALRRVKRVKFGDLEFEVSDKPDDGTVTRIAESLVLKDE